MEIVVKQINNFNVHVIKEPKFKFVNVRATFLMDLDYNDIAAYNLLLNIMITRNKNYRNINEFNSFLENNYGMIVTGNYFNRGNVGIFSIISKSMNSKYSLGEDLLNIQIDTLKECLFSPYLNEESLNEVKTIYIQRLKEQLNKKTYILKKKVNSILGNDNPYGINIESDIDAINNVTLDKLLEVYNKLINSDCTIYVCGNVDNDIANKFDNFNLKNTNKEILNISYLKKFAFYDKQEFESNFLQSAISLIYECDINYNDELFYALKVFLEMLNYDLFNIIREKYNFCYYIYAISNNYLNTIEIVSEIESKNLDKIIELIDEIIKGYNDNFNMERFNICKNKILTYIKNSLDNPIDLIDLKFGFDFSKSVSSIEEFEDKYKSVNVEQVKAVSKMISLKIVSILKEASNNG